MTRKRSFSRPHSSALATGVAVVLCAPLLATTSVVGASPAAPSPMRLAADAGSDERSEALALAASTGEDVEIDAFTTETNQVLARPDGTLRLDSHREPVRTDIHGEWEPIDTTLVVNADGTIGPKAITLPVTFSAGGTSADDTVVSAGFGDESISFGWDEGTLPEPVVSGNHVTYPDVRPGVDLVFTAHPNGYSDAVVVKNEAAAQQLQQDPIEFTGTSESLDLSTDAEGTLLATAPDGDLALASPPPLAWDSSGGGQGDDRPDAETSGTGVVHELEPPVVTDPDAEHGSAVTVEVAPPTAAVNDADTVYPLFLDPQIGGRLNLHYLTVHEHGWDYYDDAGQHMRVGYCGWSECNPSTQGNARSFFSFDITALANDTYDPVVLDATVQAYQVWNATSGAQPVNLRRAGGFDAGDNYPGPVGAQIQQISSAAGYGSNANAWLSFSSSAVTDYVQDIASAESDRIRFSLSAPYEDNRNFWKKFSNDTKLTVIFGYAPKITSYTASGLVTCNPDGIDYSRGSITTKIYAQEVYGSYGLEFASQVFKTDSTNNGPWDATTLVRSTGWVKDESPSVRSHSNLPDGRYAWRASAKALIGVNNANGDPYPGVVKSTDPAVRPFTVDTIDPTPAVITSDDFPENYWGRAKGTGGTFAVQIPSTAEGIRYAFNGSAPGVSDSDCTYTAAGLKSKATAQQGVIRLPAPSTLQEGAINTLTVYTFDKAHNSSTAVTYPFYVPRAGLAGTTTTNRVEAESSAVVKEITGSATVSPDLSDTTAPVPAPKQVVTMTATDSLATVDLKVDVAEPGYYALGASFGKCTTCGRAKIAVNGGTIVEPIAVDTITSSTTPEYLYVPLGGYSLEASTPFKVTISFPNATPDAPQTIKLDYLTVAQLQSGKYGAVDPDPNSTLTLADNFAAAFNNKGIATVGGVGAALEPARASGDLSDALWSEKLADANIRPGESFTTTFATATGSATNTFDIPAWTNAADNVIAAGQRIVLPTPTTTNHVDFLVAATCGSIPPNQSIAFDLVHQGPVGGSNPLTNPLLDLVPDWQSPKPSESFLTEIPIAGRLSGSPAVGSNAPVNLYVVEVDVSTANQTKPLIEIGLPSTGATLTSSCAVAPALHVLAVAARE